MTALLAHTRYRVHDTQQHVAATLRRNSAINPRYLILDAVTSTDVDAFTTRSTASHICADMNREHRALRARALVIADESGAPIADAYARAEYELAHNLLPCA